MCRIPDNSGRPKPEPLRNGDGLLSYGGAVTAPDFMDQDRPRDPASSFGAAADLYDSVRPTYPAEAVAWSFEPLGPGHWRVADIGAGTGIMTRVLVRLGHHVIAVEPDELMRARLMATTPEVEAVPGSAENLPFAESAMDAAIAAQAYHWFDPPRARPELARVIRPGGVFAAIWNERDDSTPWVSEYSRIVEGDRGPNDVPDDVRDRPDFGELFAPVEYRVFHHQQAHSPDSLVALLRSRSYYLTATPQRRLALDSAVRELTRTHPDLAGRDTFMLPYLTRVFRATRC
jgi:SAM-dependent methyltransferase